MIKLNLLLRQIYDDHKLSTLNHFAASIEFVVEFFFWQ
jgi:hypothetical protein